MKKTVTDNGVRITSDKPCWVLVCDSDYYYSEPIYFIGGVCDVGGNAEAFETKAKAEAYIIQNNLSLKVIEEHE